MKIIESPREGMQGIERFIPTEHKVEYINTLLKVGFDTVEVGSSVSPKTIPQMRDSLEVLDRLDLSTNKSKLMMLVVNKKGAELVSCRDEISCISYPFSFSPGFLRRNMNTTYDEALRMTDYLLNLCSKRNKSLILYISLAFGNPYDEEWNYELLVENVDKLQKMGVRIIPLSNVSVPVGKETVSEVYSMLIHDFPCVEFGLHLHTSGEGWSEVVEAAYSQGCRRFDAVIGGLGGCPMADRNLLGNLNTLDLLQFALQQGEKTGTDDTLMAHATSLSEKYLSPLCKY
ncbi:MAG: hydroxymethylglutaryl-CoA lyase [Bacteroidetes bacterium]|nr:hydroxymethylglutaryl-CoA lyase [Bacteroidota bacterium]